MSEAEEEVFAAIFQQARQSAFPETGWEAILAGIKAVALHARATDPGVKTLKEYIENLCKIASTNGEEIDCSKLPAWMMRKAVPYKRLSMSKRTKEIEVLVGLEYWRGPAIQTNHDILSFGERVACAAIENFKGSEECSVMLSEAASLAIEALTKAEGRDT